VLLSAQPGQLAVVGRMFSLSGGGAFVSTFLRQKTDVDRQSRNIEYIISGVES